VWQFLLTVVQRQTRVSSNKPDLGGLYWAAHQRFFGQMLMSAKVARLNEYFAAQAVRHFGVCVVYCTVAMLHMVYWW
jgi:hypothetical protein